MASSRRSGIGDLPDGGHDGFDEADPAGARLEVEPARVMVDQVFEEWLGLGDRGLPRGRRLAHDLVGILAVRQPGDADVLELDARRVPLELADEPDEGGHPGAAGLLARRVDVVGEDDPRRIAGEQRDLAGRERGAEAGHDVVEARLVRHQGVRIALDDDRLARLADGALGLVDEIERAALVEQRRRRGVEVLRSVTLEQPAAEPHGVAVLVADREEDPGPELVVHAAASTLARGRQADLDELVRPDVALGAQRPGQLVPATGRPTELVRLDRRVREAATRGGSRGRACRRSRTRARRGRRRSRCRGRRGVALGGHPRAWCARRSRRPPAGRGFGAPPGRSRYRAASRS